MDSLKLFVVRNIACRINDSEELPKRPLEQYYERENTVMSVLTWPRY